MAVLRTKQTWRHLDAKLFLYGGAKMTVKRIVSNIAATEVENVRRFYADLFGLNVVMDHGWIVTLASSKWFFKDSSIWSHIS